MPGVFSTTARSALRWMRGTSLVADIDEGFQRLAEDAAAKLLGYSEGTAASRPSPSVPNRIWRDTDAAKAYWHDTGTEWWPLMAVLGSYTADAEPAKETWQQPSVARPTFVAVRAKLGTALYAYSAIKLENDPYALGYVAALEGGVPRVSSFGFLLLPGRRWQWQAGSATGVPIIEKHMIL